MTIFLQNIIALLRKPNVRLISRHIAGWCVFIAYEVSFVHFSSGRNFPIVEYICYYSLNILLFYMNAHVVLSTGIKSARPYLAIPALMIGEMIVYLALKNGLDYFLAQPHFTFTSQLKYIRRFLVMNTFRGIYFLGFSTLYWSVMRMIRFTRLVHEAETNRLTIMKEKAELEKNLSVARNAYLQHQINPHLLFNTLTFIHNTYYKYSRNAARCILLLVDIMRFSLDEVAPGGKTPLINEVEQIQNFIELNQLRFDYKLYIDLSTKGDLENCTIIPLILLTLTENIFKHGNLKEKEGEAKIIISVDEQQQLRFASWNLKKHQSDVRRLRSIGIRNVIKRLNYSYQNRYTLTIQDEDESYGLELKIQL